MTTDPANQPHLGSAPGPGQSGPWVFSYPQQNATTRLEIAWDPAQGQWMASVETTAP